jgi:hypothetical protein
MRVTLGYTGGAHVLQAAMEEMDDDEENAVCFDEFRHWVRRRAPHTVHTTRHALFLTDGSSLVPSTAHSAHTLTLLTDDRCTLSVCAILYATRM